MSADSIAVDFLCSLFFGLLIGCAMGLKACRLLEMNGKVDALSLLLMPLDEGVAARMFIYAVAVLPFYFLVNSLKTNLLTFGLGGTVLQYIDVIGAHSRGYGQFFLAFLPLPMLLFGKIYRQFQLIRSTRQPAAQL